MPNAVAIHTSRAGNGSGFAIHPRIVLTAAHVVEGVPDTVSNDATVFLRQNGSVFANVVFDTVHSRYYSRKSIEVPSESLRLQPVDLGVIVLDRDLRGVKIEPWLDERLTSQVLRGLTDQITWFFGYGNGRKSKDTIFLAKGKVTAKIVNPEEQSVVLSNFTVRNRKIIGGDSGGGLLIQIGGSMKLAGFASTNQGISDKTNFITAQLAISFLKEKIGYDVNRPELWTFKNVVCAQIGNIKKDGYDSRSTIEWLEYQLRLNPELGRETCPGEQQPIANYLRF